jgi:hypothetical protein
MIVDDYYYYISGVMMSIMIFIFITVVVLVSQHNDFYSETKALCMNKDCSIIGDFEINCYGDSLISISPSSEPMARSTKNNITMRLCK